MNNNNPTHPAKQASGPNKYLQLALQTKTPLAIHFNDGDVIPSCVILEIDSFNLLVKTVDLKNATAGAESIITRASIKRITSTLEHEHQDHYNR
jgi:hypothetical protein